MRATVGGQEDDQKGFHVIPKDNQALTTRSKGGKKTKEGEMTVYRNNIFHKGHQKEETGHRRNTR